MSYVWDEKNIIYAVVRVVCENIIMVSLHEGLREFFSKRYFSRLEFEFLIIILRAVSANFFSIQAPTIR